MTAARKLVVARLRAGAADTVCASRLRDGGEGAVSCLPSACRMLSPLTVPEKVTAPVPTAQPVRRKVNCTAWPSIVPFNGPSAAGPAVAAELVAVWVMMQRAGQTLIVQVRNICRQRRQRQHRQRRTGRIFRIAPPLVHIGLLRAS